MAQETQLLKLDLDTKEFIDKLNAAEKGIESLGKDELLKGLTDNLGFATKFLGVIGTVGLAAKAALDLTLQAESVKSVNQQFEILTRNAGLSAGALADSLKKIADGLVDDTDLLKAANSGLIQLGENAAKLPEIFSLARSVTAAFGGDLIENFERINQSVATGNTRALKQYGLIIDNDKAVREYARALGITVDALSEQDRRTAILNATLEKGKTAFAGISDEALKATNLYKQLQVAISQIAETFAIAFEKFAGRGVQNALSSITNGARLLGLTLQEKFGAGAEAAGAAQEKLRLQLKMTEDSIGSAERQLSKFAGIVAKGGWVDIALVKTYEDQLKRLNEKRAEMISQLQAAGAGAGPAAEAPGAREVERDAEAASRRLAVASKFEADLLNLRMSRINQEISVATSVEEIDRLTAERKQGILDMLAAKEEQVRAAVSDGRRTEAQAELEIAEYRKAAIADTRRVEQSAEEDRLRALENLAFVTRRTTDGFAAGFKAASARASNDMGNFAKMGQNAFQSFSTNAKTAFIDLGRGTKSAADIMKSFFLNALADMAESQGAIMLLNITNPPAVAAGAALLALSGLLRSLAGQSGGGGGGGVGAASMATAGSQGGISGAGSALGPASYTRPDIEESRRRRDVQLVIQGNYFETEQTKRALMEMIRSETDATGFSYVQIGQGA